MSESSREESPEKSEPTSGEPKDKNSEEARSTGRCYLRPSSLQQQTSKFASNLDGKSKDTKSTSSPAFSFANPFRSLASSSSENGNGTDLFGSTKPRPNNPFAQSNAMKQEHKSEDADKSGKNNVRAPATGGGGFVFGQNMQERATNADANQNGGSETTELTFSPTSTTELTFSPTSTTNNKSTEPSSKSLEESAQEYQSRQVKRTYEEVSVVTGEEGESNVTQIASKLFAFDKTAASCSPWIERGRGLLRLNDKEVSGSVQSRIIMRNYGSYRVVLNAQVWADMKIERPSDKSLRITVCEADGVKLYLIMANPKDIDQLYNALECRISSLRTSPSEKQPSSAGSPSMKRARLDFLTEQKEPTSTKTDENKDNNQ